MTILISDFIRDLQGFAYYLFLHVIPKPVQCKYKKFKNLSKILFKSSVVDPDPNWIRIQELYGSGSKHVNIG